LQQWSWRLARRWWGLRLRDSQADRSITTKMKDDPAMVYVGDFPQHGTQWARLYCLFGSSVDPISTHPLCGSQIGLTASANTKRLR